MTPNDKTQSKNKRQLSISFALLMLLCVTLACSITRNPPQPTPTPTNDPAATVNALQTQQPQAAPPVVEITGISPSSPVDFGTTVTFTLNITHEVGASIVLLEAGLIDEENPDADLNFVPITNRRLPPAETEVETTIEWTPTFGGDFIIQIIAEAGPIASNPVQVPFLVNGPAEGEGQPTPDNSPCIITASSGGISLRAGPNNNASRITILREGDSGTAIGRNRDASGQGWFYVPFNDEEDKTGWVNAETIDQTGNCPAVPLRD